MSNQLEIMASISSFFIEKTQTIPSCNRDTKSYIAGVFSKPEDLSNQSITLVYAEAVAGYKFELFQKIGDWLLFAKTLYPESLTGASPEYYDTLARCSYYKCYNIVNRQWKVFEELADMLPQYTYHMRKELLIGPLERSFFGESLFKLKFD